MPRNCVVFGCKSNYRSTLKETSSVATFKFPNDEVLKEAWTKATHRKDWKPTLFSAVCALHFKESDFINYEDPRRKRLVLKKDAIPSVFPDLPRSLSKPSNSSTSSNRVDPQIRKLKIQERMQNEVENFLSSDKILGYDNFLGEFSSKLDFQGYSVEKFNNCVIFFIIEKDEDYGCSFSVRITILNDLTVNVVVKNSVVSNKNLEWILPHNKKATLWSQLSNLLIHFKHNQHPPNEKKSYFLENAMKYLQLADDIEEYDEKADHTDALTILINQIRLLKANKPRYDPCTIKFSFLIYSHSSSTYEILRRFLILPSVRRLQSLSSSFHISPINKNPENDESYLKYCFKELTRKDTVVALLIDEIYINSQLDFKSNNILGVAENCALNPATTILTFMIKSVFGNHKEVVKLIPVSQLKAEYFFKVTKEVISLVQKSGYTIFVIITDNNRINQALFKLLSPSGSNEFINPDYPAKKILLMYDPVHLLKNVRNNWLNLKNYKKTFVYSDFDSKEIKNASFQDIVDLYNSEISFQVRQAYKLNKKTISPNSFERQNVKLALNVFHDTTISALKCKKETSHTGEFCEIILKWWDILNTKSSDKGIIKRNDAALPFRDAEDLRIKFLENFIDWLNTWNENEANDGTLSKDTFSALVFTTKTVIKIINIGLTFPDVKYILLGKFQTDDLERRFGLYRSLSGCSYKVSYCEVVESEKKIRIHNMFSKKLLSYTDLIHENHENSLSEPFDASPFEVIFESFYVENVEIDDSANFYTAGYASHSIGKKINCVDCKTLLINAKGENSEHEYFNNLQKGGLKSSTNEVNHLLLHMLAVFQAILRNSELKEIFLSVKNQKGLLCYLTIESINTNANSVINFDYSCSCGLNATKIFNSICLTLANVVLNNFVKKERDNKIKTNSDRKLTTLNN